MGVKHISESGDTLERSVIKTALYRVLMFAVTFVVAFALTGNPLASIGISIGANVIKTLPISSTRGSGLGSTGVGSRFPKSSGFF